MGSHFRRLAAGKYEKVGNIFVILRVAVKRRGGKNLLYAVIGAAHEMLR